MEPAFLTQAERERSAGFRFEKRREEWLLGRWTAKNLLAGCGLDWAQDRQQVQIGNEPGGAPFAADLAGNRRPGCLSISHRQGLAFCAFSPQVQVGADLEWIEKKDAVFFADYFTPAEQATAAACPPDRRDLAILLAWSGKEALFKALGTGLRLDTRSVEVGGYGWLKDRSPLEGEWYPLTLSGKAAEKGFSGAWMTRAGYVYTLAYPAGIKVDLIAIVPV